MTRQMPTFGVPSCKECGCPDYVNNCSAENMVKRAKGRRLYPGERYCLNGKRAVQFKRNDPWRRVPSWCPRRLRSPAIRVYTRRSVYDLFDRLFRKETAVILPWPRDYILCAETSTYHTPRQFYLLLRSGNTDYRDLLGWYPRKYDVIEADIGVGSYFLFWGDKGWEKLYSFDKSGADSGCVGVLQVHAHNGLNLDRYSLTSRVYADFCIGYTRGYFGGGKFHHHWTIQRETEDNALYKEHEELVLTLEQEGFLKSYEDFSDYCRSHFWARFEELESLDDYGFYVDMGHYSFYLRCMPKEESSYHIYIFAYRR